MAGFLYLGAGLCMTGITIIRKINCTGNCEEKLSRKDLPYTIWMIILDIIAPICLLYGLNSTTAANASLLNNFEIVATSLIALVFFKEKISLRLWLGILFITISCGLLSFDKHTSLQFTFGSVFILFATFCWGLENNCTKKLSSKDPLEIVLLKGVFSGSGSIIIGIILNEQVENVWSVVLTLGLGAIAYGLSIFFYVYAQRLLGASRTSAYYAISPFIGTFLSLIIFREIPKYPYFIALCLMIIGAWLASCDKPIFKNKKLDILKVRDK